MKRFGGLVLALGITGLAVFVGCADGDKVDPVGYLAGIQPEDAGAKKTEEPATKKVAAKGPSDDKGKPATGDDDDDDDDDDSGISSSTSSGGGSSTSSSSSGGSTSSSGGSSSSSGATASSSSSSSSSSTSSSSSGSSSSSSGTTPPPPPPNGPASCATTSVCTTGAAAFNLGYVAGDTGADVLSATGYASHWIRVTVGEDSLGGGSLRMKATLTSPPGENFDLFLHADSCNTPNSKSEKPAGTVDTASISRPDATFGGSDDYYVLLEVRHVGAEECNTGAKWTLKVEGNKQ